MNQERDGARLRLDDQGPGEGERQQESVERQLVQYAFMREEHEREVRLLFRDVPADEIARAFRAAGAALISLSGERVGQIPNLRPTSPSEQDSAQDEGEASGRRVRKWRRPRRSAPPMGDLVLRYFYALGEIVYTVSILMSSGVAASVVGIYPTAALSESELSERLAVVFSGATSVPA